MTMLAAERDLMGRLSTMVRRGSLFGADDAPPPPSRTPVTSPHAGRKSLGDGRPPPFQLYVGGPQGNVAVVPPLAADEAARRAETTQRALARFGDLHARFAPATLLETAVDNQLETLVEEEWRASVEDAGALSKPQETPTARRETIDASVSVVEDQPVEQQQQEQEEESAQVMTTNRKRVAVRTRPRPKAERSSDGAEELDFEGDNLPASVRRLMRRISKHDAEMLGPLKRPASNQDEEGAWVAARRSQGNNDDEDLGARDSPPAFVTPPRLGSRAADPVQRYRRASNLLCSSDEEESEVQDRLTASVRRLVIGLKDDSDRHHGDSARCRRRSSGSSSASAQLNRRRRGNSCPAPYSPTTRSAILDTPCPLLSASPRDLSPGCLSPAMDALTPPLLALDALTPPPPRKKSALARIAPRLFETLHLRKPLARSKRKNATAALLFTDQELESIEGARWKIVELAFRFGGKHRFYLVQAVNMFFPVVKYGRRGGPHATRIHCNHCGSLQWQHKRGGRLSEPVDLADVLHVTDGRHTAVFLKYETSPALDARSFSLILADRTLDLETHSEGHRDWLMSALRTLVSYAKRQRHAEQQAIAESAILPIDDFVDCATPKTRTTRSVTTGSALPAFPPANASIRAV